MLYDLINALEETLLMVFGSGLITLCIGFSLALILVAKQKIWLKHKTFRVLHKTAGWLINATQSIPYIVLMIALIPVTKLCFGTEENSIAAILPLTLATLPFFTKSCIQAFEAVPKRLIEAATSMGASSFQIQRFVLIPEALSNIIQSVSTVVVQLIGYSTIAGTLGCGGLGKLLMNKAYPIFQVEYVLATVVITIVVVQLIQLIGRAARDV